MARRKGVSKTRNLGARKLISENSSLPKEENRLKNDQSNPRDMEESKLISKKLHIKGNEYQKDSKISADRPSHRKESSDRRADDDELVHRTPSDSTISTDLISSNNNNSKTLNSSSNDLKYLHKKFKRIASATLDEVQRQPPEVVKNLQTTLTNSQENSVKSAKGPGPHAAFNGHVDYVNIKREFLASELNGEGTEGVGLSNNFKVKFSPCNDDSSHSNFSIKVERTSSPVTSQNNNVLGRLPLIVSNFSGSTVSTVSVTNVGSSLRVHQPQVSSQRPQQREVVDQSFSGRHVCPYCNLNCTKPSVLQKHIRAHTNERPYPCDTCGFAFKTKSNYYKHCRSRSHALRTKGGEAPPDDDASLGSDQDQDPDLSNSSSDVISRTTSPMDERTSSPAVQQQAAQSIQKYSNEKPYKPKFHNAALYAKEEISHIQRQQQQQQQQQQQHHHQQQQQQHQQQHQQHNNLNHQSHSTDYYPAALQPHQGHDSLTQQQQQTQGQLSRSRGDQAPGLPTNTQGFQHVPPPSGYVESTPLSSRESTSASFSGIVVAGGGHQLNREFLQEHISKIISQNEAIVENKELLLQKKYPKLSGKSKNSTIILSNESSNTKLAFALANKQQQQHLQQQGRDEVTMCKSTAISNSLANNTAVLLASRVNQQSISQASQSQEAPVAFQPLNLSKIAEQIDISRKRHPVESPSVVSEGNSPATSGIKSGPSRVVNQERSIIKHLLLNARGLGVPNGEGEDAVYICPLCKMEFRSAEDLKLHTSNYCQGGPSSAPISPVASPSYKYFRSNSINVSLPEFNNPNSLAKLARSSLLHLSKNPLSLAKLAWSQLKTKPSNLVLSKLSVNTNTTAAGSSNASDSTCSTHSKNIDAPLPSPGPLLGKTPLVESYNNSERKSEDVVITKVHEENRNFVKFSSKRLRLNHYPQQAFQGMLGDANAASGSNNISSYNNANLPFEVSPMKYAMCGGDVQMLDKKEDRMKRYLSSGGCVIPISECPDIEVSPKMIRTPLLSGGSFTEVSPKSSIKDTPPTPSSTPKMMIPIAPLTPSLPAPNLLSAGLPLATHFQFPPINSITAFNPLTLPPVSIVPSTVMHGDKLIPFVPGIPGPNSLAPPTLVHPPQIASDISLNRNLSPSRKKEANILNSMNVQPDGVLHMTHSPSPRLVKPIIRIEGELPSPVGDSSRLLQGSPRHSQPGTGVESIKKSFNFTRMADNISPRKGIIEKTTKSPEKEREIRHFNFENIPKVDIIAISQPSQLQSMAPLHVDVSSIITSQTIQKQPSECELSEVKNKAKSKFLRPTSLPLKPGTFTPKRHHGITPTANTLPLISPETPRPSKACIQLYLNGHAYTYLGLKCSTKMFYCTVNCPQPSYVANLHKLSMYSVWQVCAENNPHPLGLKPKEVMSLYDTRQRSSAYTTTAISAPCTVVHSQPPVMTPFESSAATSGQFYHHQVKSIQPPVDPGLKSDGSSKSSGNVLVGGYESHEDYTYIRGRGRGRYVCLECGIRCKKPSMLKKHIRTHTDVRPYTCQHCSFSFKTKGNLTKHMQSKTHYKKCLELGINPGPMPAEGEFMDTDGDTDQQSVISAGGRTSSIPGESDSDDYSDIGDNETESSDTDESKSRLPEHEAARCLLSLSMTPPANSVSQHMHQSRPQYGFKQMEPMQVSSVNAGRSSEEVQHAAGQPYSSRRVISFTSPKPPFDYQKQEQYYSNPSIIPKGRDEKFDESSMKPIDLTKPRQVDKPKIFEVIGDLTNESGLLKSLVSITDKIRSSTEPAIQVQKMDESVLLQAYLTEQALQYTKIKQSQMNKHFPEVMSCSSTSTVTLTVSPSRGSVYERVPDTVLSGTPYSSRTPELSSVVFSTITTPCTSIIRSSSVVDDQLDRSIDKDCEKGNSTEVIIPAPLDHRLESSRSPSLIQSDSKIESEHRSPAHYNSSAICPVVSVQEPSKDVTQSPRPRSLPPGTGGAKSVASEYLKMTSAELLKSRSSRTEESEESSSDQEINVTETGSSIKPPADFAGVLARTVIVGEDGFKNSSNEVQPMFPRVPLSDDGRPVCTICSKTFQKQHQMVLHMNIHYMERKFKCEPCAVSFRTQGHLQKHERSEAHKNKVMMTSTFGVPTTSNPRPFECSDCKVAFRIHGHLAKHLRSKTHVQKLECLQKLPFGTYAEIERAGISLTEIDTTDCDNSLASLKALAQKLIDKDPTKLNSYSTSPCMETNSATGSHESGSEDSPDRQAELNEMRDLPDVPLMAVSVPPAEGSGLKRKFDSVNNCSNDSFAVGPQETLEKRLRTTSET